MADSQPGKISFKLVASHYPAPAWMNIQGLPTFERRSLRGKSWLVRTSTRWLSTKTLLLRLSGVRVLDMNRRSATLLDRELQATVRSGIFRTKAEAVQEALGALFTSKPQYRIEAAIEMLRSGEVTLGRAAEIAGMNYFGFRELWLQRGGRQGVEVDAADADVQARRLARRRG